MNYTPLHKKTSCVCLCIVNEETDMSPKRSPMAPKEIVRKLKDDGWFIKRKGPGDHVQWAHPTKKGKVTVDMGVSQFPPKTLKSIFDQAGWPW